MLSEEQRRAYADEFGRARDGLMAALSQVHLDKDVTLRWLGHGMSVMLDLGATLVAKDGDSDFSRKTLM